MPYILEIMRAGDVMTVRKYYTLRYNVKGEKRSIKEKITSDCQQRVNERLNLRKLAGLMNNNFTDDTGMLVTFTYAKEKRAMNTEDMQTDIRNLLKKLRKVFIKAKEVLKYIYVKERGSKGAAHIHMVMSNCSLTALKQCWDKGFVQVKPLNSDNDYTAIAKYFLKYSRKTINTDGGQVIGKRWSSSRNLVKPVVLKMVVNANSFSEKANKATKKKYEKEGFYLVPDEEMAGYNEFGFRYYEAKYRKIRRKEKQRG